MRLTQWTDYTLRVLMYCAAYQGREQPVTINEVAQSHGISRSHLTKIVQELAAQGLLETTRGRGGGMRLMKPAHEINVGAVVRSTETDFHLSNALTPAPTNVAWAATAVCTVCWRRPCGRFWRCLTA